MICLFDNRYEAKVLGVANFIMVIVIVCASYSMFKNIKDIIIFEHKYGYDNNDDDDD